MKNLKLFLVASGALIMASCGNNKNAGQKAVVSSPPREEYVAHLKNLEGEMHKMTALNEATARLAIQAYSDYATFFPNDTLAPACLF